MSRQPLHARPFLAWLSFCFAFVLVTGCADAAPAQPDGSETGQERPGITLARLGVPEAGDVTAALQAVIAKAGVEGSCLDGEGKAYIVSAPLRATRDLCLLNMRIVFRAPAFDTRPFITGDCGVVDDAEKRVDCGDAVVRGEAAERLIDYAYRRVLFVSAGPGDPAPAVTLERVSVDMGIDPAAGSRTDAAGVWIEGARRVRLRDVEITGSGKGHGLMIADSRDVETSGLYVHDLVWAPYAGDKPLDLAAISRQGWNRPTMRELDVADHGAARFVGTRVQEQLACVTILRTRKVALRDTRIAGCRARFADGDVPWQADGLDIGNGSSDVSILGRTTIADAWEGVDIVGTGDGVSNVQLDGVHITDSFAIGLKLGHRVSGLVARQTVVDGAGLAGIMIYGPVDGVTLADTRIGGIGDPERDAKARRTWAGTRDGVILDQGDGATPRGVVLDGLTVIGGTACSAGMRDRAGSHPTLRSETVTGCSAATR